MARDGYTLERSDPDGSRHVRKDTPVEADPPLACTLSSPDLAQRLAEIRSGLLAEVECAQMIESGYRLEFPNTSDIANALLDFIRFERQCCPFVDFGLGLPPEP